MDRSLVGWLTGSIKTTRKSVLVEPVTAAASPLVNDVLPKVTVRLLMLLAVVCDVALPVSEMTAVVALVRITVAVNPAGTLVTTAPGTGEPLVPAKVPFTKVAVTVFPIDPLLPEASVKVSGA